jgi:hypothetical protein
MHHIHLDLPVSTLAACGRSALGKRHGCAQNNHPGPDHDLQKTSLEQ